PPTSTAIVRCLASWARAHRPSLIAISIHEAPEHRRSRKPAPRPIFTVTGRYYRSSRHWTQRAGIVRRMATTARGTGNRGSQPTYLGDHCMSDISDPTVRIPRSLVIERPWPLPKKGECWFYHYIDLPGGETLTGTW